MIILGMGLRLFNIAHDDFYFFDAGMYLNYGRIMLDPFNQLTHKTFSDYLEAILHWWTFAFRTDRPLWQLLVDARIFFQATENWAYIRGISAVMGILTIGITYQFARKLYRSDQIGLMSAAVLALLPSHVFYSRLGLPDATTTLLFLLSLYLYIFPRQIGIRTFLSSLCLACAFFTNYRCLILPLFVVFSELIIAFSEHRRPDIKKCTWSIVAFLMIIVPIALFNSSYIEVTSQWIFRQAGLARSHFSALNLFSYPYQIFRLENWPFALLLLGNIYFIYKKDWLKAFPFSLVCLRMAVFSFSSDKAARYLCAVTPFMAMAAALLLASWLENAKDRMQRNLVILVISITIGAFLVKTIPLITNCSAYAPAMEYLKSMDPDPKVVSTQPLILKLFTKNRNNVIFCPEINDDSFLILPEQGYRFFIIGPQAYVGWTNDGMSFSGDLGGVVGFFDKRVKPLKVIPHLNEAMLERFVFEHNQNLARSIAFMKGDHAQAGDLRIYDFPKGIALLKDLMKEKGYKNVK